MDGTAPRSNTTNIFLFAFIAIVLMIAIVALVQTFLKKAEEKPKTPEELAAEKEQEEKLAAEQKAAGKPDLLGQYGKKMVIQAWIVMKETGNGDVKKSSLAKKGIDGIYGTTTADSANKLMGRTLEKSPLTEAELKMMLDFLGNSTITKWKVTKIS